MSQTMKEKAALNRARVSLANAPQPTLFGTGGLDISSFPRLEPMFLRCLLERGEADRLLRPEEAYHLLAYLPDLAAITNSSPALVLRTLGLLGDTASAIGKSQVSRQAFDLALVLSGEVQGEVQPVHGELLSRMAVAATRHNSSARRLLLDDSIRAFRHYGQERGVLGDIARRAFAETLLLKGASLGHGSLARNLLAETLTQVVPGVSSESETCLAESALCRLLLIWVNEENGKSLDLESTHGHLKTVMRQWLLASVDHYFRDLLKWAWGLHLTTVGHLPAGVRCLESVVESLKAQGREKTMVACAIDAALWTSPRHDISWARKSLLSRLSVQRCRDATVSGDLRRLAKDCRRSTLIAERRRRLQDLSQIRWSYPLSVGPDGPDARERFRGGRLWRA